MAVWPVWRTLATTLTACLATVTQAQTLAPAYQAILPEVQPCPANLGPQTQCLRGRDYLGAWYWMAKPADWNGVLIVHAHGGPELGDPKPERTAQDLQRWGALVRAGYAWVGSSYRQGGVEVLAAAEDTERARQEFITQYGPPRRTVLHGQSWGASVAERAGERYTTPDIHPRRPSTGRPPYDALLLTSGMLGGARSYDVRLDLRVVYQALCNNHPAPDEPAYPLWMGLPLESTLTRAELARRFEQCTGAQRKPAERSAEQQARLKALTQVTRIPESALLGHLQWATWHFHDIVWRKLKGRNPFGNEGVRYSGSGQDEALNQRVAHYRADPAALAALMADTDPTGLVPVPMLTLHGVNDPTAFVELESQFRDTVTDANAADRLLQVFTNDHDHSYLSDAQYLAALESLLAWVDSGQRPTPAQVAQRCKALPASWNPARDCRILPDYRSAALEDRVPLRRRSLVAPPAAAPVNSSAPMTLPPGASPTSIPETSGTFINRP